MELLDLPEQLQAVMRSPVRIGEGMACGVLVLGYDKDAGLE